MPTKPTLCVVAGVIERDGRILICQRKSTGRHALKWEFPGGKCEPGETPPEALARELREELGIEASIGPEMARYSFRYEGGAAFDLIFFRVGQFTAEPVNLDFAQITWEERPNLLDYDFLEGDIAFVRRLASGL